MRAAAAHANQPMLCRLVGPQTAAEAAGALAMQTKLPKGFLAGPLYPLAGHGRRHPRQIQQAGGRLPRLTVMPSWLRSIGPWPSAACIDAYFAKRLWP